MKPINMNLSLGPEAAPTLLKVTGALVLVGTLGYAVLVPAPSVGNLHLKTQAKLLKIKLETKEAEEKRNEDLLLFSQRKSQLPPDAIGPNALSRITDFARANGLTLAGFRPQRTVDTAAGLTEYPYQIAVQGPFPAVVKLARMVEERTRDISVVGFQASSADAESDRVAATVTIAIFRDPPPKSRTSNSRSATAGGSAPAGTGRTPTTAGSGGGTNG